MNTDRFRFRAWDVQSKLMITYPDKPYNSYLIFEMRNYYHCDEARIVVMQCTGLKDSEGKLIWEGDILEIKLDDYRHQKPNITYDDVITPVVTNICEVRYRPHRGFVALVKNNPYKGKVLKLKTGHDKIIGNIYENPELLL